MRKKSIESLFDNFMWYLIYLLPLFCMLIISARVGSFVSISETFNSIGLGLVNNNFVYTALIDLFGVSGAVPFFVNADILLYCSYFICVYFVHLAVDVLLFIPRWCHCLMDKGGKHE